MRKSGKVVFWNDEKGFGFIESSGGQKRVLAHISSFRSKSKTPVVGQVVSFELAKDKNGRLCTVNVLYKGEKASSPRQRKGVWVLVVVPVYFSWLSLFIVNNELPSLVLAWQLGMSFISFVVYAMDKSAARSNHWRTPESTLHLLDLLGGWPGGLFAQQTLRHKSNKPSFQFVYWLLVIISIAAVVFLQTDSGATLFERFTGAAEIEWSKDR